MHADPRDPAAVPGDWVRNPDAFERLRELAIAPPLAYALQRAGDAPEPWRSFAAEQAMRNHVLLLDAAEITRRLADQGVPCILLKGAALLATAYPAPARHLDDIDVLVPAADAARARAILLHAGYVTEQRFEALAFDGRPLTDHHDPDHHAEIGLISPLGTAVDLHRHVAEHPDWTFEHVDGDASDVALATGGHVRVPSPAWQMRILCDHILDHHDGVLRYWPRHLFDVGALWHAFGEQIDVPDAAVQASLAAWRGLHRWPVASGLLSAPAPRVDRWSEVGSNAWKIGTRNLDQLVNDPSRVFRKLAPAREALAASYGTTPDDPRLPWLYLHRVLTLRFVRRPEGA